MFFIAVVVKTSILAQDEEERRLLQNNRVQRLSELQDENKPILHQTDEPVSETIDDDAFASEPINLIQDYEEEDIDSDFDDLPPKIKHSAPAEEARHLLRRNLVQKFNSLREKNPPRSHQTDKIISELKDDGIEIFNSVLDRQIVVWLWCKSETGLTQLQKLNEANSLMNTFTRLSPDMWHPKIDELVYAVSICRDQFKRKVGKFLKANYEIHY